jgi:hypothetical protein
VPQFERLTQRANARRLNSNSTRMKEKKTILSSGTPKTTKHVQRTTEREKARKRKEERKKKQQRNNRTYAGAESSQLYLFPSLCVFCARSRRRVKSSTRLLPAKRSTANGRKGTQTRLRARALPALLQDLSLFPQFQYRSAPALSLSLSLALSLSVSPDVCP